MALSFLSFNLWLCWTGEEEYESTQASHQTHVHSQAQLALTLHHLLQQRGMPQGAVENDDSSMSFLPWQNFCS